MLLEVKIQKKLKQFTLDVEFQVENAVMGLMGSSGSGKSMTLKCIAGIERPDQGRIVLDGKILFDSERHIDLRSQERRVGYMFQSYALFPNMSVRENILCGLETSGSQHKLQDLLERFQLTAIADSYPRQISGGQKQRVALARMLAAEPKVLLLDEPFSALDSDLKQELQGQLKKLLVEIGRVALLVSHDQQEITYLTDSYQKMEQGSIKDYV